MNTPTTNAEHTRALLSQHCSTYPGLQTEDIFKYLYHSAFGCDHLVSNEAAALHYIQAEYAAQGDRAIGTGQMTARHFIHQGKQGFGRFGCFPVGEHKGAHRIACRLQGGAHRFSVQGGHRVVRTDQNALCLRQPRL